MRGRGSSALRARRAGRPRRARRAPDRRSCSRCIFALWSSDRGARRRATWSIGRLGGRRRARLRRDLRDQRRREPPLAGVVRRHDATTSTARSSWATGRPAHSRSASASSRSSPGLAALVPRPGRAADAASCACSARLLLAGHHRLRPLHGMKAAYLSTRLRDARRGAKPDLHRAAPLRRHRTRARAPPGEPCALAAATAYARYLVGYALYHVVGTPYEMGVQLYSDALGFAILQQANRYFALDADRARMAAARASPSSASLLCSRRRGSRDADGSPPGSPRHLRVFIVGWNVTGEIAAAAGTVSISRELGGDAPAPVHLGRRGHATASRRSIWARASPTRTPSGCSSSGTARSSTVSSLDGTRRRAGASRRRRTSTADGHDYWTSGPRPVYDYAVEDWPCVDFAGTLRGRALLHGGRQPTRTWRLIELTKPNRLALDVHAASTPTAGPGRTTRLLPLRRGEAGLAARHRLAAELERAVRPEPGARARRHARDQTRTSSRILGRVVRNDRHTIDSGADEGLLAPHTERALRGACRRRPASSSRTTRSANRRRPRRSARRSTYRVRHEASERGRRTHVGEARAEHEPRERPVSLQRAKTEHQRPRQTCLRNEERLGVEHVEAGGARDRRGRPRARTGAGSGRRRASSRCSRRSARAARAGRARSRSRGRSSSPAPARSARSRSDPPARRRARDRVPAATISALASTPM